MIQAAKEILKNAYLYLVDDNLNGKKSKLPSTRIVCAKCGKGDKTLRKVTDKYICNDCYKETKNNGDKII